MQHPRHILLRPSPHNFLAPQQPHAPCTPALVLIGKAVGSIESCKGTTLELLCEYTMSLILKCLLV